MKLVMDERLKHRLVGVAVIVSIAAIFVPAIMKKSNQRFEGKNNISIQLPSKPLLPKVALPQEKAMFKSVRVAHVDIPAVKEPPRLIPTLTRAESLSEMNDPKPVVAIASMKDVATTKSTLPALKEIAVKKPVVSPKTQPVVANKQTTIAVQAIKKQAIKQPVQVKAIAAVTYSVQLATFSQQKNALSLVNKLKSKGYSAFFNKTVTANGPVYKVLVGQESQKQHAQRLLQQLATTTQMKGFVVSSTGIS